ncbi:MAG: hypothetical protein DRO94_03125 [Candidatus Altiarchaeales archaeon]|nr:MAG: hypothetical protein DRO94_03125 [Candidatus Altiarchaeales archaeon]
MFEFTLNYLVPVIIGCLIGVVTGLTPGLHVNTIAIIGLSLFPSLNISSIQFTIIMVSMAITHTFLDFIPGIFLGIPEEDTALNILPMHQLVIQGRAMEAVKLTAYGSLLGLGFALLLLIPMLFLIPLVYHILREFIIYILIIAILFLIGRELRRGRNAVLWAIIVFFLSGFLGIIALNTKLLSQTLVLFPIFVGLFGMSNIIYSLGSKTKPIHQEDDIDLHIGPSAISSGFIGSIGGMLVGILPAMSPSQIGILIFEVLGNNVRNFIVSISAINTSDAIYSFISLYTIHNPRSGVATIVGKIINMDFNVFLLIIGVVAFSAVIATQIHLIVGRIALNLFHRINYRILSGVSMAIILILVYIFTGIFGMFILFVSTSIGLLPIMTKISRTHLMGVLLLPTILYFIGILP